MKILILIFAFYIGMAADDFFKKHIEYRKAADELKKIRKARKIKV